MGRLLAFGEMMLRLSPPDRKLLAQASQLDVWTAGAEANVARALAILGHDVGFATALPNGSLGDTALRSLAACGVDTDHIVRGDGRMGLYFVTPGAGLRPSEVIYDRTHSAFAQMSWSDWNWGAVLDGVDWLHLSGITPALGPSMTEAALAAVEAAHERGVVISFDSNYRAQLWESWASDPRSTLLRLIAHVDVLFGNHRDVALLLGHEVAGDGALRRRAAAEAAFDIFPKLRLMASTARHVIDSNRHLLSARIDTPDDHIQTDDIELSGIVDRIGAGDAFAAGVLDALRMDHNLESVAKNGLALACLKHSLPGDATLFARADLEAFTAGGADVRR